SGGRRRGSINSFIELQCNKSRGAWIEIRPPGLHVADVVLHIPGVITLPIRYKNEDRASVGSLGHQSLYDLRAPVIPVLYVSQARTLSSDAMSWDDLNAIGAHCIMAEGIGEHSLKIPPRDAHYMAERLQRVRSSIMLFVSRQNASTTAVELVVGTTAPDCGPRVKRVDCVFRCTNILER
ncbi:Hypothetical protein, putative, partial [Bodo saltans]